MVAIATQCPFKEGEAVYSARVLLRAELDSNIRFDPDCSPDSTGTKANRSKDGKGSKRKEEQELSVEEPSFKWKPNPTDARTKLIFDLGGRSKARVRLLDMKGRQLRTVELEKNGGSRSFDLSDLGSGVYLYKVSSQGEQLETGRVVIQQ